MGGVQSCSSAGALLMVAAANGDVLTAQEIIRKHPRAALYHNFKDKSSPLLQAAARGHFELLQMIIEAAVMSEGPEKTRKLCIDHANLKKQTALMVACKHGHPECVEYLVSNGADPLVCDERRHNTCLHLGALYGHSECIHKLLGVRSNHTAQGRQLTVAQIPFQTDSTGAPIKFVDAHNGWGLTALHIAVFQGAVNTARALLRHGASLESLITPPRVENSPIRCAVGSNALHIAAVVGNVAMARVILEAQEAIPGLELRTAVDSTGLRPQEYAQRARNLVLVHLLDDRLPVHLLRQVWLNYSLDGGMPARHQTLGSMLQKLKLMFNLEVIAAQRNISVADAMLTLDACLPPPMPTTPRQAVSVSCTGSGALSKAPAPDDLLSMPARTSAARSEPGSANSLRTSSAPAASAAAAAAALAEPQSSLDAPAADIQSSATVEAEVNASETPRQRSAAAVVAALAAVGVDITGGIGSSPSDTSSSAAARALEASLNRQHMLNMKAAWQLRLREINALLVMVSLLYDSLQRLVGPDAAGAVATDGAPVQRSTAHEAILDFILSMLITPRTVSAVLHSAKKLVTATVQASGTAGGAGAPAGSGMLGGLQPPATSSEAQHSMGLLLTALKAVETCLQAAAQLSEGNAAAVAAAAAAGGGGQGAAAAVVAAATGVAPTARPRAWAAVDQPTAVVLGQDLSTGVGSAGDTSLIIEATATTTLTEATGTETSTMNTALEAVTPTAQDTAAVTTMEGDTSDVPDAPPHSLPLPAQQPFLLDQPGHAQNTENLPVVDGASMPVIVGPYDPVQLLRSQMAAAIVPGATSAAATLATSHWSSHLHTLLAQLQWDIGIQRHRRRRQHAAQAANRATATPNPTTDPAVSSPGVSEGGMIGVHAAAAGVGGGVGPSPLGMPLTIAGAEAAANSGQLGSFSHLPPPGNSPAALAARYEILAQRADVLAAAHQDMQAGLAGLAGADQLQANAVTNGALSVLYRVLSRRGDAPQDVLTASDPITEATQTTAAAAATMTAAAVTSTASVGSTSAVLEWAGRARSQESTELSGPSAAAPTHSGRFSNNLIQHGSILPTVLQPVVSVADEGIIPHLSGQIREAEDAASGVLCTMPDIAPAGLSLRPSTAACFEDLTASRNSLNACGLVRSASKQRLGKAGAGKDGNHGGEWHGDDLGDSDSGCGSMSSDSEAGVCAICMDLPVAVMVSPCLHGVCVQCALQLTVKGRELPSCPFCRRKISGFEHKVMLPAVGAGHHREKSNGKAPATASQAPSAAALPPGMLAMNSMTEWQR